MNHLLKIDTARLPKPEEIIFRDHHDGRVCVVIALPSIASARKWGRALELHDTDPECDFIMVRQEAGVADRGPLRVHVIGTESTPRGDQEGRLVIQTATRATREAVTV
jgi:hypothetical protein